MWRLRNKYYTARVRLLPAPDPPHEGLTPEGHIIYLTEAEVLNSFLLSVTMFYYSFYFTSPCLDDMAKKIGN